MVRSLRFLFSLFHNNPKSSLDDAGWTYQGLSSRRRALNNNVPFLIHVSQTSWSLFLKTTFPFFGTLVIFQHDFFDFYACLWAAAAPAINLWNHIGIGIQPYQDSCGVYKFPGNIWKGTLKGATTKDQFRNTIAVVASHWVDAARTNGPNADVCDRCHHVRRI